MEENCNDIYELSNVKFTNSEEAANLYVLFRTRNLGHK
jgi:hypothetical protein